MHPCKSMMQVEIWSVINDSENLKSVQNFVDFATR